MFPVSLDFDMIANNDEAVIVICKDRNGTPVNIAEYIILWGLFLNGVEMVSKTSVASSGIVIADQTIAENVGKLTLSIDAADTVNFETEIYYIHEFSFTDPTGKSINAAKDVPRLPVGKVYLRRQYKKQS